MSNAAQNIGLGPMLAPWFERHKENLAWAGLIASIALFALAIGVGCVHTPLERNTTPNAPLRLENHNMSVLAGVGIGVGLTAALFFTACLAIYRNEQSTFDLPALQKSLLVIAIFITLVGVGLLIDSQAIRTSSSFNYEKNADFTSLDGWKKIEDSIPAALAAGSICLFIGAGVGALALVTSLPQKIYAKIEAWRLQRSKEAATREIEKGGKL